MLKGYAMKILFIMSLVFCLPIIAIERPTVRSYIKSFNDLFADNEHVSKFLKTGADKRKLESALRRCGTQVIEKMSYEQMEAIYHSYCREIACKEFLQASTEFIGECKNDSNKDLLATLQSAFMRVAANQKFACDPGVIGAIGSLRQIIDKTGDDI